MYISHVNILPGRVTSITDAQTLAEAQKNANDALIELRNANELRELAENDESMKNISPALRAAIMKGDAFNISRPTDNARRNVCVFVMGTLGGIAKMFDKFEKEAFLSMDEEKLTELSREAVELSKKFAQAFPMKSK